MRDTPIHVVLIEPGPVTSKFRANSIPQFERWVDWKSSVRAPQYESELIARLHNSTAKTKFELPPEAVVQKLVHAVESTRPRPRYYVTAPTYMSGIARRLLPTRALDWMLTR
jgi:hypothetical protein